MSHFVIITCNDGYFYKPVITIAEGAIPHSNDNYSDLDFRVSLEFDEYYSVVVIF